MRILVVDDERSMADSLKDNLEFEGYSVDCAYGGEQALDCLKKDHYVLVILDVMMPDIDGFAVLEELQKAGKRTPVIMLTARSAEADKLRGLGLGADDYVTKPFSVMELIARVKAVLKRTSPGSDLKALHVGNAAVDFNRHTITTSGKQREIGRFEASILQLLASDPGKVFSRDEILDTIWGLNAYPSNRTIDNYIVKLRQKLGDNSKQPKHLMSVYGAGYKLLLDGDQGSAQDG